MRWPRATGKEVNLVTSDEHTEIDTGVVERLVDPLVHLVRNAVYHGIEPAGIRRSQGKPAAGTIYLHAAHRGNSVLIEVEDDGAGLDIVKIKAKAVKLGLVRADVADSLLARPGRRRDGSARVAARARGGRPRGVAARLRGTASSLRVLPAPPRRARPRLPVVGALLLGTAYAASAGLASLVAPRSPEVDDVLEPFARASLGRCSVYFAVFLALAVAPVVRFTILSGGRSLFP